MAKYKTRTCMLILVSVSLRPYGLYTACQGLLCSWDFPGENTGLGCHFLLQGIFQIQGLNSCLLSLMHCQADSLLLSHLFSSVTQSCPILCDPMNRSTPALPVHHQLPESTQTHVHRVSDAIQPSHPLSSPSPPALNLSQHQGLFQ